MRQESVYFYTLHRCASSLFSGYVLRNVRGLRLIDYEDRLYNGEPVDPMTFEKRGFIYGPIRLSYRPQSLIYKTFVSHVSRTDFIRGKIAIFFIRDPRDLLVSSYYSFGYTHGFSKVKQINEQQCELRDKIRRKTIDTYALEQAKQLLICLQTADALVRTCRRGLVLRYEDMICNWQKFSSALTMELDFDEPVLCQTYDLSRPLDKENLTSHRRSGRPGAYREELSASTVAALNVLFAPVFARYQYEA